MMPKHGMIVAMFGPPSRLAHDDDDNDRNISGDREQDTLDEIYDRLSEGDEGCAQVVMQLAQCLQKMVHAASRGDDAGLKHWYQQGRELLDDEMDGER